MNNRPPPQRSSERLPLTWLAGNLLIVVLFANDLRSFDDGIVGGGAYWGRDFVNVWTGGRLVIEGRVGALYDLRAYHAAQVALFGPIGQHNYSYPPLALFLNVPFALLPYGAALAAWMAATGALFVAAARPWWRAVSPRPAWWLLLTPAATLNLWAGHYGFLIGALFLLGWRLLPDRKWLAGVCFGLMAVKPHLAVLVPLVLVLRGEWRAIGAAALTAGGLVAASIVAFGVAPWAEYLTVTLGVQAALIDPGGSFFGFMATSVASALLKAGTPDALAYGVHGVVAAGAIVGVALAARRVSIADTALLVATGTFLVLPYAFNYDLTVVALAAAMLLARLGATPAERAIALAGFVAPQVGMAAAIYGLPLLPIALIALFAVQLRAVIGRAAPASAAAAPAT